MRSKQRAFLKWAEAGAEGWPQIKRGRLSIPVLYFAVQEGVAEYLRSGDILPLRRFLEEAVRLVPRGNTNRSQLLRELAEVYGFVGDFEAAWRLCVENGLDTWEGNYLVFAVRCPWRKFKAHQAYCYVGRLGLTDFGHNHKQEILPLVEAELDRFELQEGKNIFDFYLSISAEIVRRLQTVPNLEFYQEPKGADAFEKEEFRKRILNDYKQHLQLALDPFESRLKTLFENEGEYDAAMAEAFSRLRDNLSYSPVSNHEFLYGHFYAICTGSDAPGKPELREVFADGKHQVPLPIIPQPILTCLCKHVRNIFRGSENKLRQTLDLPRVGQGWVSEASLLARLKKEFPDEIIVHHARPKWIERQHLDIYFPRVNLAVEYQGVQHERALPFFGGDAGLQVRKGLDQRKKEQCRANGCLLVEVFPDDPGNLVVEQIRARLTLTGQESPEPSVLPAGDRLPRTSEQRKEKMVPPAPPSSERTRPASRSWKESLGKDDLAACARHGDDRLIRKLAEEGAAIETFLSGEKETLLFVACKAGNIETTRALLELGSDPNLRDFRGASVLSKICNRRGVRPTPEIVRLLLARGADPNLHGRRACAIFDRCGYARPMIGCAIDSFLDCAKVLLEAGVNINQRQPGNLMTPLMSACHACCRQQFDCRSLETIRWLVENGASLKMRSIDCRNAMDFALGGTSHEVTAEPRLSDLAPPEILRFLYEAGAHPAFVFEGVLDRLAEKNFSW